jgi:hypothetical protein
MTAVLEMFAEDRLAHPYIPHVFVLPRLMTHLWRKSLARDADILITLNTNHPFWPSSHHEPLIVVVVLPCTHRANYFGPWVARGTPPFERIQSYIQRGLRLWSRGESERLPDLEGHLPGVWENQEEWLRAFLLEFLSMAGAFPHVQECVVRKLFQTSAHGPLPHTRKRGR